MPKIKTTLACSCLLLASCAFAPDLLAQTSETAIVQQAVQLQQEAPTDTRIMDYFEQMKANPTDPAIHVKLGDIYYERALYELAISSYRHALELQPNTASAHLGLSLVFRKKKLPALEIAEMEAAVADAPQDPALLFKFGNLCMEPEHFDYKKAKKQYEALKKLQSPLAAQLGGKMGLVD
ncbi:MAG: tetratricopeptide repeat protein [Deltaproteobacteria bacterium]|nr:tetratricopeptide repeat protein [Deltaproteobacteria bacterium]